MVYFAREFLLIIAISMVSTVPRVIAEAGGHTVANSVETANGNHPGTGSTSSQRIGDYLACAKVEDAFHSGEEVDRTGWSGNAMFSIGERAGRQGVYLWDKNHPVFVYLPSTWDTPPAVPADGGGYDYSNTHTAVFHFAVSPPGGDKVYFDCSGPKDEIEIGRFNNLKCSVGSVPRGFDGENGFRIAYEPSSYDLQKFANLDNGGDLTSLGKLLRERAKSILGSSHGDYIENHIDLNALWLAEVAVEKANAPLAHDEALLQALNQPNRSFFLFAKATLRNYRAHGGDGFYSSDSDEMTAHAIRPVGAPNTNLDSLSEMVHDFQNGPGEYRALLGRAIKADRDTVRVAENRHASERDKAFAKAKRTIVEVQSRLDACQKLSGISGLPETMAKLKANLSDEVFARIGTTSDGKVAQGK